MNDNNLTHRWWVQRKKDIHQHVFATVNAIENSQTHLRNEALKYWKLYENRDIQGYGSHQFSRSTPNLFSSNKLALNVVKACVDTVSSKIAKNKPHFQILTDNGNFQDQQKAKKLNQYVDGLFDACKVFSISQDVFVDCAIFGTGALKVYFDNDTSSIKVERVFPFELIVDEAEAFYGNPNQIHTKRLVDRDVLLHMFPEFSAEIESAQSNQSDVLSQSTSDQILVVESWHLKSSLKAKDGMHTVCINNATLFSETYKHDFFPFIFMKWSIPRAGFFGRGLAADLIDIQVEINKILIAIQQAQHFACVPRVFVDSSSGINSNDLKKFGGIVKFTGTPPIFNTAPGLSPEIYSHLEYLYRKAFEATGISMLSAASKKPDGIDSAVAMREYQMIETERFYLIADRHQEFFLNLAKTMIALSREAYENNNNLTVKTKGKSFISAIKWSDVDLADDKFIMQAFPVNGLPQTPPAKLQTVMEMVKSGIMDQDNALSLLDYPDLKAFTSLKTSALDYSKMVIETIMDKGVYIPPNKYMNLEQLMIMAHSTYDRCQADNSAPQDRLELLITLMDAIEELLPLNQPQQQQDPSISNENVNVVA